jgi:hypothetical protein
LETLTGVCHKTGWQVHAYGGMGNHFPLAIETPQPDPVAGMKWVLGQEAESAQAERWVVAEPKRLNWSEADLKAHRKGEPRKVGLLQSEFPLRVAVCAWCEPEDRAVDLAAGLGAISHAICPCHLKKLRFELQMRRVAGHLAHEGIALSRWRGPVLIRTKGNNNENATF